MTSLAIECQERDEGLRKSERLRKRPEFLRTRRRGRRAEGRWVVVYAAPGETDSSRVGITVSKKVGKAVVRNHWKRRLREIFRHDKDWFGPSLDVVIIAKRGRQEPTYRELRRDVKKAVRRAVQEVCRRGAKR